MNHTPIHNFFVFNGELKPNNEFIPLENAGGVYEVLRVLKRVPLFLHEHLERFYTSAEIAGRTIQFSKNEIAEFIRKLIEKNRVTEGNILLSCKTNLKAFFIAHRYPAPEWYTTGVKCGILHAERNNPNAKVFQTSVRQKADKIIQNEKVYEVLLVDHIGRITEGSRSNVFFVKDNRVLTPPADEVLLGITRQKTIGIIQSQKIYFLEDEVLLKDMESFDAAFITGTSPKILPVSNVGNVKFNPQNEIVRLLIDKFDAMIQKYVQENKA
ncbi:MAG: aminotransferase class IV [Tangfeifania sp.]